MVLVIGGYATAFSIARAVVSSDPALAHRLAPYDGRITGAYAASLTGPEAGVSLRRQADELASRALRQDATTATAASTLGLNAQVDGDAAAARRYFGYAQILSRREFQTQLWAIEDAVARGDVRGALDHYDIALRTKASSGDLFFPILASANQNPEVRAELVGKLGIRPPWGQGFINYLPSNGLDPRPTMALFLELRRTGVAVSPGAQADLVEALINGGFTQEAWSYYTTIRPGADRSRSRDPRFGASANRPTPFDWMPVNEDGIATSIQGGVADFTAPVSGAGVMLRQMQLLPPGTYRLSGHSIGVDQEAGALPYWTLTCGRGGHELGRVDVPRSDTGGGRFAGIFTVSTDCPVQVLALVARPSEAMGGLTGQIDSAKLEPVR